MSSWLPGPLLACGQSWQSALALPAVGGSSKASNIVADGTGGYVVGGGFSGTLTSTSDDLFVAGLSAADSWPYTTQAGF